MSERVTLNCGEMQLALEPGAEGLGYRLYLRQGDGWRPVSAAGNPLVRGATFNLFPAEIVPGVDGSLLVRGTKRIIRAGEPALEYPWHGRLQADQARSWFHIEITVNSPTTLPLQMLDGFEPEITLDLGLLPPYERGDHVWFKTSITNPTTWNDEAYSNDFPGTYYYDPYLRLEMLMFFDMTAMSWMGFNNVARFLNYRCGFRRRYRPAPMAEVGLYADGFSGKEFPSGPQTFAYWLTARHRNDVPDLPTEQEALQTLVNRSLVLVPPEGVWPERATSWQDFSQNCARELMDTEHCWGRNEHGEYILNYVDAFSPAWKNAIEARGNRFDMQQPCLESALWSIHPLSVLMAIDPDPIYPALRQRLLDFAQKTVMEGRTAVVTGRSALTSPFGTWQYVYVLEEIWQMAMFEQDNAVLRLVDLEVENVLIPLVHNTGYLLPLLFDKHTLRKMGNGDGNSIAGLYSFFMLELYAATERVVYMEEAKRAIRTLCNLPVNVISQEAFLTAQAVQAASRLYVLTKEAEFAEAYTYLLAQSFRMMYLYSDRTSPAAREVNNLGMVLACCTINYTALLENIDVLARLAPTFKMHGVSAPILTMYNHARRNNFYFFQQCLPEAYRTSPLNYIPHEDIPLLEGPTGEARVGQEIYGAGWTFRAYLLWEAYGHCLDRDLMLVNLNGFEERQWLAAPQWELTFVLFNPEAGRRVAEIDFPVAAGRQASVQQASQVGEWSAPLSVAEKHYATTLDSQQMVYLKLTVTR
jgi:hypothetical protein